MPEVFFYGLFMDRALLADKGLQPLNDRPAKIEGYSLRIGKRATLVPTPNSVVHGIVMTLSNAELHSLYNESSVRDYRPEWVTAVFSDDTPHSVLCFNLPDPPKPEEHNEEYATKLKALANRLGLPADYVDSIK
jgi:hypothetical protein